MISLICGIIKFISCYIGHLIVCSLIHHKGCDLIRHSARQNTCLPKFRHDGWWWWGWGGALHVSQLQAVTRAFTPNATVK